ncbi:MAG: molecular chaperone DnaJ [Clostridia bacterium]|nr:molecular chaperone DnaJ [Clostridia bacterium]
MMAKNYYDILGVDKSASQTDIKSAYFKLAKKYHPDVNKEPEAAAKFKEINEAYSCLGDEQKRKNYDQFGNAEGNPFANTGGGAGGSAGGFGFGDFGGFGGFDFEDIFSSFGFGTGSSSRQNSKVGSNIALRLNLTFEEAALGVTKTFTFNRTEKCEKCNGTGAEGGELKTCPTCNGTGQVRYSQNSIFGRIVNVGTCSTCNGRGKVATKKCSLCGGAGTYQKSRTITVTIPAGIDNGQEMTIAGEGNFTSGGVSAGNLILQIAVSPHKMLTRNGFDLYITVPIPFTTSLLGGTITIPVVAGKVTMDIPPLTQTGTTFTVKGKGIKKLKKNGNGDLIVTVTVEMPKTLDKETREKIESAVKNISNSNYTKCKDYENKLSKL